ncbi:MAG: T9SS type A sorting domain-containing protein [Bacteroidia bacterium]
MNKYSFVFLLSCFSFVSTKGFSQFAIAGVSGLQYHDVVPDTTLQGSSTYSIDMNGDGVSDLGFTTYTVYTLPMTDNSSFVNALNSSTSLLFDHTDSCYIGYSHTWIKTNILKQFSLNDTITSGAIISGGYFARDLHETGTHCLSNEWIGTGDKYVGVKYQDSTGMYFGWVRINVAGTSTITIKDYSLNKPVPSAQGIKSYPDQKNQIRVYPNPASEVLHLETGNQMTYDSKIEILNSIGQIVLRVPFSDEINLSGISPGYYVLKLSQLNKLTGYTKFIKE